MQDLECLPPYYLTDHHCLYTPPAPGSVTTAQDVCAGVDGVLPHSYQHILHHLHHDQPLWLGYPADEAGQCIASLLDHNNLETLVSVACHLQLRSVGN